MVMMLGQIFMQEVSGADNKVHFLILGFFILTHQAIIPRFHLYFEDMNLRKKRIRDRIRVVESASFTPLVFPLLAVLAERPPFSIVI